MGNDHTPQRSRRISSWNIPLIIQLWIFFLVLLFFQLGWETWENELSSLPWLEDLSQRIGHLVLSVTPVMLNALFDIEILRNDISLILPNQFYVSFFFYLSGIKQMALVVILFIVLPGPWSKKLWYTPACLLIVLFTVFLRFLMLTLHSVIYPEHFHLIQTMLFGPLFYFEIVVMWAVWVLLIAKTASLKNYPEHR